MTRLILSIFFAFTAAAEVPLHLIRVTDYTKTAPTYNEVQSTLALTNVFFTSNIKIYFKVSEEYEYRNNTRTGLDLNQYYSYTAFHYWFNILSKNHALGVAGIVSLTVLPPLYDGKLYYYGGQAYSSSAAYPNSYCIVFCGHDPNKCRIVTSHELGHVIGMQHLRVIRNGQEVPNIMHPAAGQFGSAAMTMLHRSKSQCRRYLQRHQLWRKFRS